jgi:hypothetical protein
MHASVRPVTGISDSSELASSETFNMWLFEQLTEKVDFCSFKRRLALSCIEKQEEEGVSQSFNCTFMNE